ncbi:MAG TPA: bifunctional phosphoribosylaminoimidazolecarboxamide formyltransferase/IMP cyclohydrolase [Candidatus Eisenbacteria bacterium]|jgi:phosphoribosylaminoimidazolecarboxamide formyltransferase/IMP cyclohydrolase
MSWPRLALLSLSDKRGAAEFARALAACGTRLLASGGTAAHLRDAGLEVTPLERWTGFEELIGGRVKTLHPHVHAAILARRDAPADLAALEALGIAPIDLVAVSLYPFEERAAALAEAQAMEEVDIGGVALLRAAAKNHRDVIVVHDRSQYGEVLAALGAGPTPERRRAWAISALARTARYDAAIASDLARRADAEAAAVAGGAEGAGAGAARTTPPAYYLLALERLRGLRYGENPHQSAALYARAGEGGALDLWREGRELSYNNLLDLEAAVSLAARFAEPACVIVKHGEPCGAACAATPAAAWESALATDELSAYGGIAAFNRPLDGEAAARVAKHFVECVAAPEFAREAEEALGAKKNLRALRVSPADFGTPDRWSLRLVGRWGLLQGEGGEPAPEWRPVTKRGATADELRALRFAWELAAAARSNAVAIARGEALVGLGSGQTSRVDAVDVALMKARRAGHDLAGAALASDGFFPFADNVEHAAAAGIRAIVQPGGSMRDAEVIAACDRHGIAMLTTGRRTFRH